MKKIILITGCSSGFGYLSTLKLCEDNLIIAALRNSASRPELVKKLTEYSLQIDIQDCDVCDPKSISTLFSYIKEKYQTLDILINNAGVFLGGFFEDCTQKEIELVMNTNVYAVFNLTKEALPLLRASKGKIINISSSSGLVAMPTASIYAASKHALEGWSEALHYELAPFGVSVSCIEPQTYKTEIVGKNLKITSGKSNKESVYHKYYDPILEKIIDQNKLGRNPDEVIRKILKIVNKKQVKLRYLVGPSTKLKYALKYFLPFELFNKIVKFVFLKLISKQSSK